MQESLPPLHETAAVNVFMIPCIYNEQLLPTEPAKKKGPRLCESRDEGLTVLELSPHPPFPRKSLKRPVAVPAMRVKGTVFWLSASDLLPLLPVPAA